LILVTVGTSLPHDELIMKIDELVQEGKIRTDIFAQIGVGKYIPKNLEHIRFAPSLEEYYQKAEIIISNCGAGTIMENVTKGRKLIVVQNPDITGGHEWELVIKMEEGDHLIWCKNIDEIESAIRTATNKQFKQFKPRRLILSDVIAEVISSK